MSGLMESVEVNQPRAKKSDVKLRAAISVVFSLCVGFVLLLPLCAIMLQAGFKDSLPEWFTSQDATYLSGQRSESIDIAESFSYECFKSKELQNDVEDVLSSNVPFKATALVGNAALQRLAISSSNLLFGWECYPTFYSSGYVAYPSSSMTLIESLGLTEENTSAAKRFSEVIAAAAESNPDVRFVYQAIDETHSNPNNPSWSYISDSYPENWFEENIFSQLGKNVVALKQSIDDAEDMRRDWFSSEHHWRVNAMLDAYDSVADVLDLQRFSERDEVLISDEWQGASARGGLMMDYPSDFSDIPTDFSHLTCIINGEEQARGARASVLDGTLPLNEVAKAAYYNFYHWYYGGTTAEVVYENSAAPNDRTLLFVEQSYGVPMEPYLASNYKTTVCISPANAQVDKTLQQYIDEYNVDDVVIQMGPQPYSYIPGRSPAFLEE